MNDVLLFLDPHIRVPSDSPSHKSRNSIKETTNNIQDFNIHCCLTKSRITISVIFLILYDQDRQEFHEKFPRRYEAFYNLRKTGRRRSFLRQLSNMYSPCSPLEEISTPHGFHFLQRGTNDGTLEEAKYDLVGNG
ncbi:hypothetical protein V1477_003827 [Vespula maculifrons]|uniref:Uncharacterized protein n=1 Tax=Vespula maculifrons TaxID=7453 RepID=A0ABD2CS51_VESMC